MTPQQALRTLERALPDVDPAGETDEGRGAPGAVEPRHTRRTVIMNSPLKSAALPLALGISMAVAVSACGSMHASGHHPIPAAERSQAKSDLKQVTARCIPASAVTQVRLAHSLLTKSGRQALVVKCGVPAQHKAAFEAQVLNAAEHGHLTTKGGRMEFFTVTLPKIIVRNQA